MTPSRGTYSTEACGTKLTGFLDYLFVVVVLERGTVQARISIPTLAAEAFVKEYSRALGPAIEAKEETFTYQFPMRLDGEIVAKPLKLQQVIAYELGLMLAKLVGDIEDPF